MKKDFDKWNKLKQKLDCKENLSFIPSVWEVWYISIGINIWSESLWKGEFFKRPVLIIKKLWNMFFCVSMTTKWKDNNIFYSKIDNKYFNKSSYIIKSQIKTIDKKRCIKKIWKLSNRDFYEIKKELREFLF